MAYTRPSVSVTTEYFTPVNNSPIALEDYIARLVADYDGDIEQDSMFSVDPKLIIHKDYKFKCRCPICGSPLKPSTVEGYLNEWHCPKTNEHHYSCYSEINEYIRMRSLEEYVTSPAHRANIAIIGVDDYKYLRVDYPHHTPSTL